MRTIKFRAWFKPLKRMYIVRELKFERNGTIIVITNHTGGTAPNNYELMQFTGLKDKNGKEIYEGDIVKMSANGYFTEETIVQIKPTKGIVFWGFFNSKNEDEGFGEEIETEGELIGNIYENPELLDAEQDKKGCGKVFYMTERVGKRRSGHQCTCGNNKWGYLCDKCQDQDLCECGHEKTFHVNEFVKGNSCNYGMRIGEKGKIVGGCSCEKFKQKNLYEEGGEDGK